LLWDLSALKKYFFFKTIPGALVVVVFGVLMNAVYKLYFPDWYLQGEELVQLPVAASFTDFTGQFTMPDFGAISNYKVYSAAVTIAIIASLESLLSVEAADKLDPYKRNTPANRELMAQGVGNIVSGLIGGIPITAVIVRSSANVTSGAKTKLSAVMHGIFLLVSVVGLASVLNKIPLACLAALLLLIGYKLAKVTLFKTMFKLGWDQFLPFVVTVIAIQFSDLLKGIGVGMAVSIFFILRNNYKSGYFFQKEMHKEGEKIVIQLSEDVTFINKGAIMLTLENLPANSSVIIDGTKSKSIDIDVLEIIHEFKKNAEFKKINLELIQIPEFKGVSGH
ncbi:MAG: SulP family inorganic anion transporter, partial [Bacteroidia bacterium]|nr:SulP family inorganic anion transporter [Bacteroidia bacterium]